MTDTPGCPHRTVSLSETGIENMRNPRDSRSPMRQVMERPDVTHPSTAPKVISLAVEP